MPSKTTKTEASTATDFEFFEGAQSESTARPQITVRRGGLIVLTRAAVDLLGDDVEYVQLGFNPNTQVVGIRAADDEAQGRYRLRTQKKSPSRLIGGKRFFGHYGLSVSRAHTFDAEVVANGIVGFRLGEASAESAS
ncbi:MAG: hypothetical protein AAGD06_31840 [Acidobacteriota bacterium]